MDIHATVTDRRHAFVEIVVFIDGDIFWNKLLNIGVYLGKGPIPHGSATADPSYSFMPDLLQPTQA